MTEQLYVVLVEEVHSSYKRDTNGVYQHIIESKGILGFSSIYKPETKAFKKRKDKQDYWAYRGNVEVQDDGLYIMKSSWVNGVWGSHRQKLDEKLVPKIMDNEPRNDFKIVNTVSRSTTQNKLWRIQDARGFELEISTANMETILMNGTVSNGVLVGDYKWYFGKNGVGSANLVKA